MKFWAFILAFFTLFLSVKPGVAFMLSEPMFEQDCCKGGACSTDEEDDQDQDEDSNHEDDDCGTACNPFQSCCTHALIYQTKWIEGTAKNIFPEKPQYALYKNNLASQFATDFWQPPRFI